MFINDYLIKYHKIIKPLVIYINLPDKINIYENDIFQFLNNFFHQIELNL